MRTTILSAALLLMLGFGVAVAEEIVFFTNGTEMPVSGHEIDGEMIRVDLGSDGWLAFPRTQVERIEAAGREVFPATGATANRIIDANGQRSYPVKGRRPGRYSQRSPAAASTPDNPAVGQDANGIPVYHPLAGSPNAAARKIGATGHSAATGGDADAGPAAGLRRTHQLGNQRYNKTGTNAKPKLTGIARAAGARGSSSSGGSSGSGSSGASGDQSAGGDDD